MAQGTTSDLSDNDNSFPRKEPAPEEGGNSNQEEQEPRADYQKMKWRCSSILAPTNETEEKLQRILEARTPGKCYNCAQPTKSEFWKYCDERKALFKTVPGPKCHRCGIQQQSAEKTWCYICQYENRERLTIKAAWRDAPGEDAGSRSNKSVPVSEESEETAGVDEVQPKPSTEDS